MITAADVLNRVQERIDKAAQRAGRNPRDITLMAVTKTVPLEKILPFLSAGIRHIGENRVQEALTKYSATGVPGAKPTYHLIGQLQSNKAKKAVSFFDVIQSVDRLDLARDLNRHARELGKKQQCLVEVKISAEESKSGLAPERLTEFLAQLRELPHIEVKGLMGIAPLTENVEETRPSFAKLRKLLETARLDVLSMGMSADFDIAVEEGATMLRLGSVLFGPR